MFETKVEMISEISRFFRPLKHERFGALHISCGRSFHNFGASYEKTVVEVDL